MGLSVEIQACRTGVYWTAPTVSPRDPPAILPRPTERRGGSARDRLIRIRQTWEACCGLVRWARIDTALPGAFPGGPLRKVPGFLRVEAIAGWHSPGGNGGAICQNKDVTDIPNLPKVVLHDHLDGGLRPSTVLALAAEHGYLGLPRDDEESLAAWFDQSRSASLEHYLAAFAETGAVMQRPDALQRVAREAVEDLAADGVVYAEVRFAPSLHLQQGLTRSEVIRAVLGGMAEGERGTGTVARVIVDAMRQDDDSRDVAAVAAEFAGAGVVGFDLAGPEAGYPASAHREALSIAGSAGLGLTIHAGEGDGPAGIADALDSGAERLGHGVRIAEDVVVREGRITDLGPIAGRVHGGSIALEICPYSNVHTGAVASAAAHPAGLLLRAGFNVTLNTDNRLMSGTSMSREFAFAKTDLGFSSGDLRSVTEAALQAAFCDEETRRTVAAEVARRYGEA